MITDISKRESAIRWLKSDRDFNAGVALLQSTGFKPAVVAKLARVGVSGPEAPSRLLFLMREFISLFHSRTPPPDTDAELHVFEGKESPTDTAPEQSMAIMAVAERVDRGSAGVPAGIAKVVHEYATLYKQRDKAMRLMGDIGEQNDEASMAERKRLSDQINDISTRMERLYPLYERYLQTTSDASDDDIGRAMTDDTPTLKPDHPDVSEQQQRAHLASRSKAELHKERKNVRSRIRRSQNMLDYQTTTEGETPNPMPEGVERLKYESRIKRLKAYEEKLCVALAEKG